MPNTFKFVTGFVGLEALRILKNSLEVARVFNTEANKDFKKPFAIGDTTTIKLPQRFTIRDQSMTYSAQTINRKVCTVKMDQYFGIDFEFDSLEQALKMEKSEQEISDQYIKPAMAQIAQEIDSRAAKYAYQNTNNIAGVLGTTPTTNVAYQRARTLLVENACPTDNQVQVVSPAMLEAFTTANAAVYNPPSEIAKQYRTGEVGEYAGATWVESMSLYDHVSGVIADVTVPALNGAPVSGDSTIKVTMTAGDTLKKGDVIAFDFGLATQVNNVNPATRRSTGRAKTFVVTADFTAVGGGNAADVVSIYPTIEGPLSQYCNVSALPGAAAKITLFPGSSIANGAAKHGVNGLRFGKDAFALVSAPLEMPSAVEPISFMKHDPKTGIAIRFVRAWDQAASKMTNRFDVLLGFGTLYGDNGSVRVLSLQ